MAVALDNDLAGVIAITSPIAPVSIFPFMKIQSRIPSRRLASRLFERGVFELLVLALVVSPATALAASPELRWQLSPSEGVVGYVVYLGSQPGFFDAGAVEATIDLASNFQIESGIAHYPVDELINEESWVAMTAYDAYGAQSDPSNEILLRPGSGCSGDADCTDGDRCNGAERCDAGSCVVGVSPHCEGGDQCSEASCDSILGCIVQPLPNGQSCDDGNLCSTQDTCQSGTCTAGGERSCPNRGPCESGFQEGES